MLLTQFVPKIPSPDVIEDDADLACLNGDPVLGFARVISQVKGNTRQFRGWGP